MGIWVERKSCRKQWLERQLDHAKHGTQRWAGVDVFRLIRTAAVGATAAVVALAATGAFGVVGRPSRSLAVLSADPAGPSDPTPGDVLRQASAYYGEPLPQDVGWTSSTRATAVQYVSGAFVDGDPRSAVYVVEATGRFRAAAGKYPQGTSVPSGAYLVLVVDVSTREITDVTISPSKIPLENLGPVQAG